MVPRMNFVSSWKLLTSIRRLGYFSITGEMNITPIAGKQLTTHISLTPLARGKTSNHVVSRFVFKNKYSVIITKREE